MRGPAHTRNVLADFQSGETRLVFARDMRRTGGALVELPQGEARQWRDVTREHLRCPVPDCERPELKTVSRAPARRDGFSHMPGAGGHAPESLFHIQGKARIAQWLRERHPEFTVELEYPIDAARTRVADVMATSPAGRRFAFEIQYAKLDPEAWEARDRDYLDRGITPVWLFGHHGHNLKARLGDDTVELNAVQLAIRAQRRTVLWVNPVDAELATVTSFIEPFGWVEDGSKGKLMTEPLELCWLDDAAGLRSPMLDDIKAANIAYAAHLAAEAEAERRRQAELEAQRAAAEEKRAETMRWLAETRREERRQVDWARPAAQKNQWWAMASAEGPNALKLLLADLTAAEGASADDAAPAWLFEETPHRDPITPTPEWRAVLFRRLTITRRSADFTIRHAVDIHTRHLPITPVAESHLVAMMREWCALLAEARMVVPSGTAPCGGGRRRTTRNDSSHRSRPCA